jgi:hypothetical protein
MRIVKSLEKQPYCFKGAFTWYDEGTEFEVIEENNFGYKLKSIKYGVIFDGFNNKKDFDEVFR